MRNHAEVHNLDIIQHIRAQKNERSLAVLAISRGVAFGYIGTLSAVRKAEALPRVINLFQKHLALM